jgi:hypothetical protein
MGGGASRPKVNTVDTEEDDDIRAQLAQLQKSAAATERMLRQQQQLEEEPLLLSTARAC